MALKLHCTLGEIGDYSKEVYLSSVTSSHNCVVAGPVGELPEADVTSTTAQLQWYPPDDPNGVITMYRLNIVALSTNAASFIEENGSGASGVNSNTMIGSGSMQVDVNVDLDCIIPGGDVGVETFVTFMNGNSTTHTQYGLSKLLHNYNSEISGLHVCWGGVSVYPLSCTMYMNLYGTCVGHSQFHEYSLV